VEIVVATGTGEHVQFVAGVLQGISKGDEKEQHTFLHLEEMKVASAGALP